MCSCAHEHEGLCLSEDDLSAFIFMQLRLKAYAEQETSTHCSIAST